MLYDSLKTYLNLCLVSDESFSSVSVRPEYQYGMEPNPPEILLYLQDDSEMTEATTFEGETAKKVMLQAIVMVTDMKIDLKMVNAQKACTVLSDKLKQWLDKNTVKKNIPSILNITRTSQRGATPYKTGTRCYFSVARFEVLVSTNE